MQNELPDGKHITGTLVWYYFICKREVWLMGHEITPDDDQESLKVGRAIHTIYYRNLRSEVEFEGIKIDRIRNRVIYEIKTSSKYMESARFQLLFYIYRLGQEGLEMKGELLIPKERKTEDVFMTSDDREKLESAIKGIIEIIALERPPPAVRIPFCRKCAYRDFCWS